MLVSESRKELPDCQVFDPRDLIPSKGKETSIRMPTVADQLAGLLNHLPDLSWEQVIRNHFADAPRKPERADYLREVLRLGSRRSKRLRKMLGD